MNHFAYKVAEGVSCRACGGVLAAYHDNNFDLCKTCWTSVSLFCGAQLDMRRNRNHGRPISESDVTLWIARKLEQDVRRLSNTGITGRCEAISGWAYGSPGTQCAKGATENRDGFKVCYRHARATAPQYVGSEQADQYTRFSGIILGLGRKDPRFAEMISNVARSLEEPS